MQELKRDIEQLYEAGQQLKKSTPTGARLALFLMDNLAELFMYRTVVDIFEWDKRWHRPPNYAPRRREKVIKYFNDKLNFLLHESKRLNCTEASVMKLGHRLRNEAYHQGILRESIIVLIASVYFEVVCRLHPRMWVGHYSISQDQNEIPSLLKSYGLAWDKGLIDPDALTQLSDLFLKDTTISVSDVAEALSGDLEARLERALDGLEYIAERERTPDDVLKHMQFYVKFWSEHSYLQTDEASRQYFQDWKREYEIYTPPITVNTLQQWKTRATDLRRETDLGLVVQKFDQLDREFLPVEEQVIEAVVAYEMSMDS